ncbi:MAG: S8 family serine peptidase [Calothrix sp. SM1_5_4]|nr:S8 family serine peptidase [Calothrix sp. SM1_5_4]
MNGFKEILLSFTIAFASLMWLARINEELKTRQRFQPAPEPAAVSGYSDDPEMKLPPPTRPAGQKPVVVALIDTGCDINHPDLRSNIWVNAGETGLDEDGNPKASNGIDDDGNGFVDDVHGWNFVTDSPELMDEHGHGTHIAGIVGAANGFAPQVSLMILKYFDEGNNGGQNLRYTVEAIRYATRMGANIINYSGGGILRSSEEEAALAEAAAHGILVVAAAGNEGMNSDFFHFYPANYNLPNILSVTAVDQDGRLMDSSNFGRATVDLAPGAQHLFNPA